MKPARRALPAPLEHREQCIVAAYLRARRIRFFAVPNGGHRSAITGARMKAEGQEPGVPDLVITKRPPRLLGVVGAVIEMKRRDGVPSDVTPAQRDWLEHLAEEGWKTHVAYGADSAISFIETLYGRAVAR
jgi:hypothetical protein